MRLSKQLMEAIGWKKTSDGYEMETTHGKAVLSKKGKEWFISVGGKETSLGKKARFDHAEGVLQKMGAKPGSAKSGGDQPRDDKGQWN